MSRDSLKVARWEFTQNVTSKGFLVLTVALPVIIILIGIIPNYLAGRAESAPMDIALAGNMQIYEEVKSYMDRRKDTNVILASSELDEEELKTQVEKGEIDGYLYIPEVSPGELGNSVSLYVGKINDRVSRAVGSFSQALTAIYSRLNLEEAGYSPEEIFSLTSPVRINAVPLNEEERGFGEIILPLGIAVLIVMSSIFSGSMVMMGIIQEKRNRIVEIVLSSIDSFDMMMGKLIGFAGLGIAQLLLWGGAGIIAITQIAKVEISGVTPFEGFYYFCYFVFGYLMIASLYTLIGATTSDIQSSGQARGIFVIVPILPIYFTVAIINSPDALWVKLVSFFPVFTPTMMLIRAAFGSIQIWEVLVSLLVLGLFVYLVVIAATKIFRVGMLMYGKDMSVKEIWKWVRR